MLILAKPTVYIIISSYLRFVVDDDDDVVAIAVIVTTYGSIGASYNLTSV